MRAVRELDPIARETVRDNPAAPAGWEGGMRDFHELEEESEADDAPPPVPRGKGR